MAITKKTYALIEEIAFYLCAFFCCFPQKISSTFCVIWGSLFILHKIYDICTGNFQLSITKNKYPALLLILLFLLSLATTLYAEDRGLIFYRLFSQRLTLILIPVAVVLGIGEINFKTAIRAFIYGNLAFILYSFGNICYQYWINENVELHYRFFFFVTDCFTKIIHRTYSGLNIVICFVGLTYLLLTEQKRKDLYLAILFSVPAILFFLINNSRGESIALIAVLLTYFIMFFKQNRKKAILIAFMGIFTIISSIILVPNNRVIESLKSINSESTVRKEPRILVWNTAIEMIKEHALIGYGVNNYANEMEERYMKNGFNEGAILEYNSHNQFLGFTLEFGIIGFLLLASLLVLLGYSSSKEEKLFYLPLTICLTVSLLFESLLDRYAGCATFSLFIAILGAPRKEEEAFIQPKYILIPSIISTITTLIVLGITIHDTHNVECFINHKLYDTEKDGEATFTFKGDPNNSFFFNDKTYSYKIIACANNNKPVTFKVDCLVDDSFTGAGLIIAAENKQIESTAFCIYDFTQRGRWQTLVLTLKPGEQSILCRIESVRNEFTENGFYLKNPRFEQ